MTNLALIQPSHQYINLPSSKYMAPYNLLRLATFVKEKIPSLDIAILNEEHGPLDCKINADYIMISANSFTYENAVKLAKDAKSNGAVVGVGGIHATNLPIEVLKNRKSIDYVFLGNGEQALCELLEGKNPERIANLAFRKNGEIILNPKTHLDINSIPIANRSFVDMEAYFSYCKESNHVNYARAALTFTHSSCKWKIKSFDKKTNHNGCIYCSTNKNPLSIMTPERTLEEIKYLVNEFGVDYIENGSDSFTSTKKWLSSFADLMQKKGIRLPAMQIYARADEINKETARLLAEINVVEVFIGFETGTDSGLKKLNKGLTTADGMRAAELLTNNNIRIEAAIIEMFPGETKEESQKSFEYAKFLCNNFHISKICAYTLTPTPGLHVFRELIEREPQYKGEDIFELEQLKKDYAKHFCSEPFEFYSEMATKIRLLKPAVDASGMRTNSAPIKTIPGERRHTVP